MDDKNYEAKGNKSLDKCELVGFKNKETFYEV